MFIQSVLRGMATAIALSFSLTAAAQESDPLAGRSLKVTPTSLKLKVGDKAQFKAEVLDASGNATDEQVFFFSRARRSLSVDRAGEVTALKPGSFTVVVRTMRKSGERLQTVVPVEVEFPPITALEWVEPAKKIYQHTTTPFTLRVIDEAGNERDNVKLKITSSAPKVASVDSFGEVHATAVGAFTLSAEVNGVKTSADVTVSVNPVRRIDLTPDAQHDVRTGDVVHFTAVARDQSGASVDVPIHFSLICRPDDQLGQPSAGQVARDGRFVAELPGRCTVVADCGSVSARHTLRAEKRNVGQGISLTGHGQVFDVHTSDLWVWEGIDGRDYCVTGTWGANGDALFWDVTDPTDMKQISKVTVDARTVNDVKVSEDGRICVISREGASNRKNGLVVVDVANPAEPKVVSTFDDELTGGVHNVFIYKQHVFALSAGRRYDVISIEDPTNPHRVGTYELETAGHSIHDVWVSEGIAYSSNWSNGVHLVDVGNGVAGGSPSKPTYMGSYAYPSGWNHAAFPYLDKQTGKFYVIAGDEAFPYGLHVKDKPTYPRGWMHFIDFTDLKSPSEVARYQVPEAGTHNLWVEGDIMYAAFYNGGLRVVDLSGELMGDLYRQGREIAFFLPTHHEGKIPNASMVWGPQPYKGNIFFTDWNSGLWAVKLEPRPAAQ